MKNNTNREKCTNTLRVQLNKFSSGSNPGSPKTKQNKTWGIPGGVVVKNLPANAGDTGSSPAPGKSHMPLSN